MFFASLSRCAHDRQQSARNHRQSRRLRDRCLIGEVVTYPFDHWGRSHPREGGHEEKRSDPATVMGTPPSGPGRKKLPSRVNGAFADVGRLSGLGTGAVPKNSKLMIRDRPHRSPVSSYAGPFDGKPNAARTTVVLRCSSVSSQAISNKERVVVGTRLISQ